MYSSRAEVRQVAQDVMPGRLSGVERLAAPGDDRAELTDVRGIGAKSGLTMVARTERCEKCNECGFEGRGDG